MCVQALPAWRADVVAYEIFVEPLRERVAADLCSARHEGSRCARAEEIMRKRRLLNCVAAALLLGVVSPSLATCTKPSGTYAGIFSGASYNTSGGISALVATELTLTVAANGSGTMYETGKQITPTVAGPYSMTTTFTAAQNSFNTTTCQGIVTLANGRSYIYASTNSGNEIRVTDYTNNGLILIGVALLQKV